MKTVNIKDFIGRENEYKEEKELKIVGIAPEIASGLFAELTACEVLDVTELDTSNTTDMSYMFNWCVNLKSVDVSNFNTSKVTTMAGMFSECWDLIKIKGLENFDTASMTNAKYMFNDCKSLESFDFSNFVRDDVNTKHMFRNCKGGK